MCRRRSQARRVRVRSPSLHDWGERRLRVAGVDGGRGHDLRRRRAHRLDSVLLQDPRVPDDRRQNELLHVLQCRLRHYADATPRAPTAPAAAVRDECHTGL